MPILDNLDAVCAAAAHRAYIKALRVLAAGLARDKGATTRRSAGQYWRWAKVREGYPITGTSRVHVGRATLNSAGSCEGLGAAHPLLEMERE